jgi:hypothetical protein
VAGDARDGTSNRWRCSSPLFGGIGGLLVAASIHLGFGSADGLEAAGTALFDVHPVLGYGAFLVAGTALGWTVRWLENLLGIYQ